MRRSRLSMLLSVALVLGACHDKTATEAATPGGETPEAAVQQSVALLKAGDFGGYWKHSLPPADYAVFREDWAKPDPGRAPLTDEQRTQFTQTYAAWTEPGAETKRYAELKPKLAQLSQQYRDQLPVMTGIVRQIAQTGIAQDKSMTATQKAQASEVIDTLAPWVQQAPWFDQDKAKQTVTLLVTTARKLDLKSADQLRTMDFATAMQKYAIGYAGLKQVLDLYGLSLDATFDSVKLTVVQNANGHARVKVDYTLLGKPLSTEAALVQQEGRWYSQDMIENVRATHARVSAPAPGSTAAPAPAVSGPAPASTVAAASTPTSS